MYGIIYREMFVNSKNMCLLYPSCITYRGFLKKPKAIKIHQNTKKNTIRKRSLLKKYTTGRTILTIQQSAVPEV